MDHAKPKRRKRSPTEEKRLSYERDRRNNYGNAPHAARKAIPRFKKHSGRQMRHGAKSVIVQSAESWNCADEAHLAAADRKGLHPTKKKAPDVPLGVVLERKKWRNTPRVERGASLGEPPAPKKPRKTRNRRESLQAVLMSRLDAPAMREPGLRSGKKRS